MKLKKRRRKNCYKILGVGKEATKNDTKKAFHKMAMQWHPDKFDRKNDEEKAAGEEKFKKIGEAYVVLKDAKQPKLEQHNDSGVDID